MSDTFFEFFVSEFSGDYPDVQLAIDIEELKKVDPDPFFVTLPIVPRIGAVSKNGLLYDDHLVGMIQEQINTNRPGALFGHIPKDKRDSADPIPAGNWVGAQRVGNQLWAKNYLPPGAAREHFKTLKALGRGIATSIWGEGKFETLKDGTKRAASFTLQNLDFASPERAALGGGHIPIVTAEMTQESVDMTKDELIAELKVADIPVAIREAIVAEATKQDETLTTIAELTSTVAAKDELISELNKQVDMFRQERLNTLIDSQVTELTDWNVTDEEGKTALQTLRDLFRNQIVTRLGDKQDASRVAEIAQAAWTDLKPIAEMMRDRLAGPAAIVKGKVAELTSNGVAKLEDTPENRNKALARMGINV